MANTPPIGGFNPNVQEQQARTYTNDFRPVSDIQGDTSLGIALKGAGNLIEGGINFADQLVKNDIDKQVYAKVDKERNDFSAALETVKAGQASSVIPGANPAADKANTPDLKNWSVGTYDYKKMSNPGPDAPLSLTPGQGQGDPVNVPPALQAGLDKIQALPAALDGGKINDTYYTQRLSSVVTDLRSQYPGYRDYIDQKVSATTGIIPANAYIKNMMEDINRQATNANTTQKERDSFIRSNSNVPGMVALQQMYEANPTTENWNKVYAKVSGWNSTMSVLAMNKALRDNKTGDQASQATDIKSDWDKEIGATVSTSLSTYAVTAGLDTPMKVVDFMDKVRSGQIAAPSGAQMQQVATALSGAENSLRMRLYNRAYTLDEKQNSIAKSIGLDAANASIDKGMEAYKHFRESITNKDYGSATLNQRMSEAYNSQATRETLEDKDVGPFLQNLNVLKNQGGETFIPLMVPKMLGQGYDKKLGKWFDASIEARVKALAQPTMNTTGQVRTFVDDAERISSKEDDPQVKSEVFGSFLDNLNIYTDPQTSNTIKLNANKYFFDKKNIGKALSYFKMDYIDPQTGETVPGKHVAYSLLTSQDAVDTSWKLRATDQQAWKDHKNFAEQSFALGLFQPDILELNRISGDSGVGSKMHLAWDNKSNSFSLVDNNDNVVSRRSNDPTTQGYLNAITPSLDRLNSGIAGVARFQEKEGGDTSEYVLKLLQAGGFSPGKETTGIPAKMMQAILASKPAPINRIKELQDFYSKNAEGDTAGGGDLTVAKTQEDIRRALLKYGSKRS